MIYLSICYSFKFIFIWSSCYLVLFLKFPFNFYAVLVVLLFFKFDKGRLKLLKCSWYTFPFINVSCDGVIVSSE